MPQPFDPGALASVAVASIRPPLGIGALAWRYTVFVPLEEVVPGGTVTFIATPAHLEAIAGTLCEHFSGLSILAPLKGWGLRDPQDPASIEFNKNVPFVVYASATTASEAYIDALQSELQRCLDQGLILIERQEVFLAGKARPSAPKQLRSEQEVTGLTTPDPPASP